MAPALVILAQAGTTVGGTDTQSEVIVELQGCEDASSPICDVVLDLTGSATAADIAQLVIGTPIRIVLILGVAFLVTYLLRRASRRFVAWSVSAAEKKQALAGEALSSEDRRQLEERASTIRKALVSLGAALAWTVAVFLILAEIGVNLAPLIAAAGVAGIAIGLGAQTLVRDYLTGLLILIENQLRIGDDVDLGEATGVVESVTLRTTTLRDRSGTLWYVPNGEVTRVANHSQSWSRALLDLRVPYSADLARVKRVVRRVLDRMSGEPEWAASFLDKADDPVVQDLAADAVVVRVFARVRRADQSAVEVELRERVKQALDDEQIEMPLPQQVVWLRR